MGRRVLVYPSWEALRGYSVMLRGVLDAMPFGVVVGLIPLGERVAEAKTVDQQESYNRPRCPVPAGALASYGESPRHSRSTGMY